MCGSASSETVTPTRPTTRLMELSGCLLDKDSSRNARCCTSDSVALVHRVKNSELPLICIHARPPHRRELGGSVYSTNIRQNSKKPLFVCIHTQGVLTTSEDFFLSFVRFLILPFVSQSHREEPHFEVKRNVKL